MEQASCKCMKQWLSADEGTTSPSAAGARTPSPGRGTGGALACKHCIRGPGTTSGSADAGACGAQTLGVSEEELARTGSLYMKQRQSGRAERGGP